VGLIYAEAAALRDFQTQLEPQVSRNEIALTSVDASSADGSWFRAELDRSQFSQQSNLNKK
jgi:hypothetical protein